MKSSSDHDQFHVWLPGKGALDVDGDEEFVPGLPMLEEEAQKPPPEPEGPEPEEILADARRQAEDILETARTQAEQITRDAQERMEREIEAAVQAKIQAVRQEQTEIFRASSKELLAEFDQQVGETLERLERSVAGLVAGIVEKVIRRKVAGDDAVVVEVIQEAIQRLDSVRDLSITVHPDDRAAVDEHRQALLEAAGSLEQIQISTDEQIQRGGCLLDSDSGEVDARIQSQLDVIWDAISTRERREVA